MENVERSRRKFLGTSVMGLAGTTSAEIFFSSRLRAQSTLAPDEALKVMMDGNDRFSSGHMTSSNTISKS